MIVGIDFAGLLFQNLVANLADDLGRGLGDAGALHSDGFLILVVQCLKFWQPFIAIALDYFLLSCVASGAFILFLGIGIAVCWHKFLPLPIVLTGGLDDLLVSFGATAALISVQTVFLTGSFLVFGVGLVRLHVVAQSFPSFHRFTLLSATDGALLPDECRLFAGCGGVLDLILVLAGSGYVLVRSCTALGADVIVAASLTAGSFHNGVGQLLALHVVASGNHAIAGIAAQGAGLALDAALVAVSSSQDAILDILVSAGVNRQNLLLFLNGIAAAAHQAIAQALVLTGSSVALNDLGVVVVQSGQRCVLGRNFSGLGSAAFLAGEQDVFALCASGLHINALIPHVLAGAAAQV